MPESVIQMRDLWFAYNGETVLEGINCQIPDGDFVAMIGPNGGGKTTLLKLMLGLLAPMRGSVRILGNSPRRVSHQIGYVPQNVDINLRFPISVLDVVLMGRLMPGVKGTRPTRADRLAAHEALAQMGVSALAARRVGQLSGGQRQRVFIARALATRPRLLFLDEPTASMDSQGQIELYNLLQQLNTQMTIVVVSHDMLALSRHIKSVACVNRQLHYHDQAELTDDMIETMYPCATESICPVELVAHGMPHRVLRPHNKGK